MTCSSLVSLGTLYQLIAQVGGISLLAVSVLLLMQKFDYHKRYLVICQAMLILLIVFAYLIDYPETSPFLGLALVIFYAASIRKKSMPGKRYWNIVMACLLLSIVFINAYWVHILVYIQKLFVFQVIKQEISSSIFPYFLVPSGIANFWGVIPIPRTPVGIFQDILVLFSIGLSLWVISLACRQTYKLYPAAIMSVTMILVGVHLYISGNGFGVFKLAMYIQPFILGVLAVGLYEGVLNSKRRAITISVIIVLGLGAQFFYVTCSLGKKGAPFVSVAGASKSGLLSEIAMLSRVQPSSTPALIDATGTVEELMFKNFFTGKETRYFTSYSGKYSMENPVLHYYTARFNDTQVVESIYNAAIQRMSFNFNDGSGKHLAAKFQIPVRMVLDNVTFIRAAPSRQLFNQNDYYHDSKSNFIVSPISKVSNYLVFISSSLGVHHHEHGDLTAFFGPENDYFFKNKFMAGVGRYLLFEIINPTEKVRMRLAVTTTLTRNNHGILPPAMVVGSGHHTFQMTGRGSARVYSSVIVPKLINNDPFILLDMGVPASKLVVPRVGIMHLFGTRVNLDKRKLVCFFRDITLVSEKDYLKLVPPVSLENFPADLDNPGLEYSGIYEDGWISESAYFTLTQPQKSSLLKIEGLLPRIGEADVSSELVVSVDDTVVFTKRLNPGIFEIKIPVITKQAKNKVMLTFTKIQELPGGDGRPVAAKLNFIGYS